MATVPQVNTAAAALPAEIENKPVESGRYFKVLDWKSYNNTNAWATAKPTSENAFFATVQSVAYKAASVFVALAETLTNILKAVYNVSFAVPANLVHSLVVKPESTPAEPVVEEVQPQAEEPAAEVVQEEAEVAEHEVEAEVEVEEEGIDLPAPRTRLEKAKDWVHDTRVVKNYVAPAVKWAAETRVVKAAVSNARMPTRKEAIIGGVAIAAIALGATVNVPAVARTAISYVPLANRFI